MKYLICGLLSAAMDDTIPSNSLIYLDVLQPLNYCPVIPCRILLRKIDSQAEGSTVSVGCVGMASDMDMSSLEWESQFVTLKFKRISAW